MSLNIKDPEARRLAQAIAKATGETITRVVKEALRERYERIQKHDPETLAADLRAIAKRAAAHVNRPYLDDAELLYDERGLPHDLDSSPLVAILVGEPDAEMYIQASSRAPRCRISAGSFLTAVAVLSRPPLVRLFPKVSGRNCSYSGT